MSPKSLLELAGADLTPAKVGSACSTRDLSDSDGGNLPARTVHNVALAELRDRFGVIAGSTKDVV